MSFSPARTWRFRISRSAMSKTFGFGNQSSCLSRYYPHFRGIRRRALTPTRELDELSQRGRLQRADDADLHARPQQLGGAATTGVGLVRAQHPLGVVMHEALHR